MADLSEPASSSAAEKYPLERRFLQKLGDGRYRIRDDWHSNDQLTTPDRPATRSRKAFEESYGATCCNWTWSWSFANNARRMVIFDAWDMHTAGTRSLIPDESWALSPAGKRNAAYPQSREHVRLIEEQCHTLYTSPMQHSSELRDANGIEPARIAGFTPELTRRTFVRVDSMWFASDDQGPVALPDQVDTGAQYREGAAVQVLVNGCERNEKARRACIDYEGAICRVCGFDFQLHFGPMGRGVFRVHHRQQLADSVGEYQVDPIRDLIPVCPNCHPMLHLTRDPLEIDALRWLVAEHRGR